MLTKIRWAALRWATLRLGGTRYLLLFFSLAYCLTLWGANVLWYKHHSFADFHWFDDLVEWQQMDKLGHVFSTFHLSSLVFVLLSFLYSKKNIHLVLGSSFIAFVLVSSIEILDGFSAAYGASIYDLIANSLGAFFFIAQKYFFQQLIVQPKFSFHFSEFAIQRPHVLGDSWLAQLLKDYNGQTYWYAFPIKFFPSWLQLAVGYSADNMLFGRYFQNQQAGIMPFRRYFISIDINLSALKTPYGFLNYFGRHSALSFANLLHLPLPALEWNEQDGLVWHWVYF